MLRPVDDLERRIAEFWPVTLDLTRSTYPTYIDGIKTREDFADSIHRAAVADWGEVLLHVHGDDVNGLVVIDQVDEDYVSLRVCLTHAHQRECLHEVLTHIVQKHAGRTLWLAFAPDNAELLTLAAENNFTLLDDSTNWTIHLTDWVIQPEDAHVLAVTRENYADFRAVWTEDGMYWNADRIWEALDQWTLHVCRDERSVRGAVACMDEGISAEIFGFLYAGGYDEQVHRSLLAACLNATKSAGKRHLTYFTDRGEANWLCELGFRRVSDYVCYEKIL